MEDRWQEDFRHHQNNKIIYAIFDDMGYQCLVPLKPYINKKEK